MKCPRCGGNNCQFVSSAKVHGSLFGWLDACCGFICLGPAGILCGFCGSDVKTKTKEYWICNDCGAKFKAGDVASDIGNVDIKVKYYYDNPEKYPEYKNTRPVQVIQTILEYNEDFQELLSKTVIRSTESEQLRDLKNQFDKNILSEQILLMALIEKNGLIMSTQGIFLGRKYIPYNEIFLIMKCQRSIFINQMEVEFVSPQIATQFWVILRMIVIHTEYVENDNFEYILEKLHNLPAEDSGDINHYSSQGEYANYVRQLTAQKFNEYKRTHPDEIRLYQKKKEEVENKEAILAFIALLVPIIIGIVCWIKTNFWVGVISAVAVLFIGFLISEYVVKGRIRMEYRRQYLPEKLAMLMEEDERDPLGKKGNINPRMYAEDFGELFTDAILRKTHQHDLVPYKEIDNTKKANKYCSECGEILPQNAICCPYCGKKCKVRDGGRNVL